MSERDPVPPIWATMFESTPRQRVYALFLGFGPASEQCTREEYDALMLLVQRVMRTIPIRKEPDWKYIAGQLARCGFLVGVELDEALDELKPVAR